MNLKIFMRKKQKGIHIGLPHEYIYKKKKQHLEQSTRNSNKKQVHLPT